MKRSELSLIWQHSRVYGVANVLNRLAGLILLPVYLHILSPAEFGVLALVTLTTDVLGVILGLGLGRAMLRFYAAAVSDDERDRLIVSSLALLIGLGVGFALLALPAAQLFCWLLFSNLEHRPIFVYANLSIIFTVLLNFELSCLMARKASTLYLWASLAKTVAMLGTNILLVVHADMGVLGVVLGTLLSSVLVSGILLVELVRGRQLSISGSVTREIALFAAPLIPSVLLDTLVAALDKLSLNRLETPAAVGGYSTAQRLSGLLQMFVAGPFMQIWAVRQMEALDHLGMDERNSLSGIFDVFLVVFCAGALFLSLFAGEALAIIASPEYRHAADIIPVLAFAEVLFLFRSYYEISLFDARATRYLPRIALLTLVIAIPTYAALVSWLGVDGAATAFLAMAAIRVALVARIARRVTASARALRLSTCATTIGGATAAFLVANIAFPAAVGPVSWALKLGVVLMYATVMIYSPAVGPHGRQAVAGAIANLRGERRMETSPGTDTGEPP